MDKIPWPVQTWEGVCEECPAGESNTCIASTRNVREDAACACSRSFDTVSRMDESASKCSSHVGCAQADQVGITCAMEKTCLSGYQNLWTWPQSKLWIRIVYTFCFFCLISAVVIQVPTCR